MAFLGRSIRNISIFLLFMLLAGIAWAMVLAPVFYVYKLVFG